MKEEEKKSNKRLKRFIGNEKQCEKKGWNGIVGDEPASLLYRLHNSAYKSMSRTWMSEISLLRRPAA